jgi:hypothetical protein
VVVAVDLIPKGLMVLYLILPMMCVSHEENITLTDPASKKPFKKKTKVHYHANQACIQMKYPALRPDVHLIIPSNLSSTIHQEHWGYLEVHFGYQH